MSTLTADQSGPSKTPKPGINLLANPPVGDKIYGSVLFVASLAVLAIIVGIAILLLTQSWQSVTHFGLSFITSTKDWDARREVQEFTARPYILGTLYSSLWALLVAVPISLGSAIFLSEMAPRWLRTPLAFLIELLAAIPSVVYGIWGVFVLSPWLAEHIEGPTAKSHLKDFVLFRTSVGGHDIPLTGSDMLAASIILAIMITPYITSVSRDILRAIPRIVRDGSYALGATQWETISGVVLPYARSGIIGAVILGLGRALGETMAVTMVIGNRDTLFSPSLFVPGATMSSEMANHFTDTGSALEHSAFAEIGLILFIVTMAVNAGARILVTYTARDISGGKR